MKRVLFLFKLFKTPEVTLASTPPPVKYLTVNVVLDGAIPYVPVNKKLVGEYAVVNLSLSNGKPIPILSGLGVISSVIVSGFPAPNCSYKFDKEVKRDVKRLATFLSLSK